MNIEDDPFAAPPPRRTSFNTSTTRRPNFPAPLSPTSTARAFLPSSTNNNNNNGYDGKPSSGPSSASLNGLFPPNTAKEVKPGSAGAMRAQLENLIEMKQQELVRAGRLGQQILSQQSELEARVKELSEVEARSARGGGTDSDGEELGEETRARLQALGEAVGGWEKENEGVWEGIRGGKTPTDDPSSSSTNTLPTSSSSSSDIFSSSTLTSTTTTQSDFLPPNHDPSQSRRTRNAAHRTNDIEFATEIGQSLLVEVRRLQTLLSERDKALEDSHREVEEGRGREEGLREVVRTLEGSADKFKEENWNLEVTLQDLKTQLSTSLASQSKTDSDLARLTRSHALLLSTSETTKNETDRLSSQLSSLKAKHEADMATMRKTAAGLQRDKSDLQGAMEKAAKAASRVPGSARKVGAGAGGAAGGRFGGSLGTPGARGWGRGGEDGDEDGEEVDEFGVGGGGMGGSTRRRGPGFDAMGQVLSPGYSSDYSESPMNSPSKLSDSPLKGSLYGLNGIQESELEVLRDQLEAARKEVEQLKAEKEDGSWVDESGRLGAGSSRGRRGGRGAGRGGRGGVRSLRPSLADNLAMAAPSPDSPDVYTHEEEEEGDEHAAGTPSPLAHRSLLPTNLGSPAPSSTANDSPYGANTSSGSMDPAFASNSPANGSLGLYDEQQEDASPLKTYSSETVSRRGGRGGGAARPRSFIPTAGTLSNELGGEEFMENEESSEKKQFVDEGTDPDSTVLLAEANTQTSPSSPTTDLAAAAPPRATTPPPSSSTIPALIGAGLASLGSVSVFDTLRARDASASASTPRASRQMPLFNAPPASEDGGITETETDGDFEDARESVGTSTPFGSTTDLAAMARNRSGISSSGSTTEFHSMADDSSDGGNSSGGGSIRASTFLRSAATARALAETARGSNSRGQAPEAVERIVEVPVDRIVEVEKLVYVDKIVEVPVEVERIVEVEKIVEVEVLVDKIVEVEKVVEVEKIVYVEKIVEVEKRVEVPIEKIVYVDKEVEVEKIVEVPVEKVVYVDKEIEVEKIVEVPVEKIVYVDKEIEKIVEVERIVEVPVEVEKLVEVEKIVEVERIVDREVQVDKIIEVPVDKIIHVDRPVEVIVEVEKIVEVPIEKLVYVDRPVEVEKLVEVQVEKIINVEKIVEVERVVEVPVEKIVYVEKHVDKEVEVERRVEVPVEKLVYVDKIVEVEKRVEVPVEKVVYVEKQIEVEKRVEVEVEKVVYVDKRVEVEKIVEVPVEKIVYVDKQVEVEVEKIVEVPVEKIVYVDKEIQVEKIVEVPVEKIVYVDKEVKIEVEKIVEVPVERIVHVDKIVEVEVERIVEKPVEVEKLVYVDKIIEVERIKEVPIERIVEVDRVVEVEKIVYVDRIVEVPSKDKSLNASIGSILPPVLSDMGLYRYDASTSSDGLPVQNGQRDLGAFFQQDSQDSAPTSPSDTTFPSLPQDRSRPPTFIIPPPPNMPPPAGITVRKVSMPPPRPLSPPPPEVYQRSITPVNGQRSNLLVPGQGSVRAMPPPNTSRPSISKAKGSQSSSFRSTSGGASRSMAEFGIQPTGGSLAARTNVRKKADFVVNSHASLASSTFSGRSHRDRAPSIDSSHSSEAPHSDALPQESMGGAATGPGGTTPSTDPQVIFAITQTMIGEFLYKYTRKTMGKGHSDKRHKRFFWVHPYTKTLYWSSADPGSTGTQESSAKSAYIESVRSVEDPNPMPPGIYHHSVIVSTPQREMKFTATSKERHDIWLNALQYLLARPTPETTNGVSEPSAGPFDTTPNANHYRGHSAPNDHDSSRPRIPSASPNSIRSFASASSNGTGNFHLTPKAKRSQSALSIAFSNHNGSVSKRNGTAAREYLEHVEHDNLQSPTKSMKAASFRSKASGNPYDRQQYEEQDEFEHIGGAEDADEDEEGYEGLDNVRACCGGIHDVGTLAGRRHIQTHHNHPPRSHSSASNHNSSSINHKRAATQPSSSSSQQTQLQGGPYSAASNSSAALDAEQDLPTRSISPSGFSLRSRGSRRSSASNGSQGVSSIFGKSSRSAKESSESNERTAAGGTIGKKGKGRPSLVERLTNSRAPSE